MFILCSDSISFPFLGKEEIARIFKRDAEGWMFKGTCGLDLFETCFLELNEDFNGVLVT